MQQPPYPPPEGPPGYGQYPPPQGPYPPAAQSWAPPPMQPALPRRRSNLGLILGVGCAGLLVIGACVGGAAAYWSASRGHAKKRAVATAPATPAAQAELRDVRTWRGEDGARRVIGEIVNTGAEPVLAPLARLTFFDSANKPIDSGECKTPLEVLARGEKTPCALIVTKSETYASYKAEITSQPGVKAHKMAELRVSELKYTGRRGTAPATLEGKITNASPFRAKGIEAIVSLYGSDQKIVASETAKVGDLDAGKDASFTAKVVDFAAPAETYRVKAVGYDRD